MVKDFCFGSGQRDQLLADLEFAQFDGVSYVHPFHFGNGKLAGKVVTLGSDRVCYLFSYSKVFPIVHLSDDRVSTQMNFDRDKFPSFNSLCDSLLINCAIRAYEDCDCDLDYLLDWEGVSYA